MYKAQHKNRSDRKRSQQNFRVYFFTLHNNETCPFDVGLKLTLGRVTLLLGSETDNPQNVNLCKVLTVREHSALENIKYISYFVLGLRIMYSIQELDFLGVSRQSKPHGAVSSASGF